MKTIARITEIIKIEPFKLTVRWTTGEIRLIDFEPLFDQWQIQPADIDGALLDYPVFKTAQLDSVGTLQWPGILVKHPYWGENGLEERESPYDIDPLVLYEASRPIEEFRLVYAG